MASDPITPGPPELTPEKDKEILDDNSISSAPLTKEKRTVSFDKVQIRSYERSLGDHPAVSSGPGLSISWNYKERTVQSIDEFEISRSGFRRIRNVDLIVTRSERERILREECGYARSQIAQCVREINASKHNRRQTINNLSMENCEERWQSISRLVSQCFCLGQSEEIEIKALWKKAGESGSVSSKEMDRSSKSVSSTSSILKKTIDNTSHHPTKPDSSENASIISDVTSVTTRSKSLSSDTPFPTLANNNNRRVTPQIHDMSACFPIKAPGRTKPRNIIAEEP